MWKAIHDELPEVDKKTEYSRSVIVLTSGDQMVVAWRVGGYLATLSSARDGWCSDFDLHGFGDITHWHELPKIPGDLNKMNKDNEPLGHDAWINNQRLQKWEAKKSAYDPTQDIYIKDLEEAEGVGEAILLCVVFILLMGGIVFFPQILKNIVELLV